MPRRRFFSSLLVLLLVVAALLYDWHYRQVQSEIWRVVGSRDEQGAWYGFWSGFAGGVRVFEWPVIIGLIYWHHTCHHSPWCLRWGKYEAAGGVFRLCSHHHPDIAALRHLPRHEMIHRLHREHLDRTSRRTPAKPRA
jgi:hypothetical protein